MMEMKFMNKIMLMFVVLAAFIGVSFAAEDGYQLTGLTETLLNQDPDPVEPGDYVELRFKIEKKGNALLEDIEYELVPEYPFSFDGSDTPVKGLGDWIGNSDDDEFYILYYKLKVDEDALEGNYELTLKQSASNVGSVKEVDFDIRVDEKQRPELIVGSVSTSPAKLIADYDEAALEVEIVNVGDDVAEQVIVDLNLPEGFEESFGYSTRANLGTIAAGETKVAKFYFDSPEGLVAGSYEANLDVHYKEDDGIGDDMKEVELPFDIKVFGRPEYNIVVENVTDVVPGEGGEIRLVIENVGSRDSDSTSIQIFKDSSQPFEFEDKSDFIGKVAVGEKGESLFVFDVDADADVKEYKLKVQIRSVVDNDVLVENEVVTINVIDNGKNDGESGVAGYFVYGICALFGAVIGYRLGGKKKKSNK